MTAAWAAQAIRHTRQHDESLPLRGLNVIEPCASGLGGFGMGPSSLGAQVLVRCEIAPNARSVHMKNVKPAGMHPDLCTLDGTKPVCDFLTLGLLCQAFSQAGKRKGFADPVLDEVYHHNKRLLRKTEARVVIIECARQFLTQEDGKDAAEVHELLMKSRYRVQHRTLNAAGFGVAQSRERSFIVGIRLKDKSHAPVKMYTTLSPEQELIGVKLRETLLLPTDDLLTITREFNNPRAGLGRCLRRPGVPDLRDLVGIEITHESAPDAMTLPKLLIRDLPTAACREPW